MTTPPVSFTVLAPSDARLQPLADLGPALDALAAADLPPSLEPVRARIRRFAEVHPDVLHRSCAAGHLTGSAVVVDAGGGSSLMMLHAKLDRWFQPGGHADGDGNLASVALREAEEETGLAGLRLVWPAIDVDVHEVATPGDQPHLHLDVRFLVVAPPDAVPVRNHESRALRWVDEHTLEDLDPDPGTRRLVHRGLAVARDVLGGSSTGSPSAR